jgi:deazaflavin-dependent oxidoreductase (nitroreductase family)
LRRASGVEELAMSRYADALRWLGVQTWFPRVYKPVFPRIDAFLYRVSGGRLMSAGPTIFPTLLLTTTGYGSGKARTTPLFYVREGESIIVAATNFGLRDHPAWSENLLRHPDTRVRIGNVTRSFRARTADVNEVARVWPRLVAFWPAYDRYKERSGRDIRVFVLDPC